MDSSKDINGPDATSFPLDETYAAGLDSRCRASIYSSTSCLMTAFDVAALLKVMYPLEKSHTMSAHVAPRFLICLMPSSRVCGCAAKLRKGYSSETPCVEKKTLAHLDLVHCPRSLAAVVLEQGEVRMPAQTGHYVARSHPFEDTLVDDLSCGPCTLRSVLVARPTRL